MRSCDRCGKGTQVGMNVSHSHIRTKKRFLPNLHALRIKVVDTSKRQTFCTKCLRTVKKEQAEVLSRLPKNEEAKSPLKTQNKVAPKVEEETPKAEKKPTIRDKETVDISQELIEAK